MIKFRMIAQWTLPIGCSSLHVIRSGAARQPHRNFPAVNADLSRLNLLTSRSNSSSKLYHHVEPFPPSRQSKSDIHHPLSPQRRISLAS